MPRVAALIFGLLTVVLIVTQLALPPILEGKVEGRLEEDGGQASAKLSAIPALRLLFSDGDSFEADGRGLELVLSDNQDALDKLDGFGEVRMRFDDVELGPLAISRFTLDRGDGDESYSTRVSGRTTPREAAAFLGSEAGGALGGLFGGLAADALPGGGGREVPFELDARVVNEGGDVQALSATGEVAGLPAGPLAEVVVDAVLAGI